MYKTKNKMCSEKGSITLFVLIAMLFFLAVGMTIFISTMNNKNAEEKNYKQMQKNYNNMGNLNATYQQQKALDI